MKCKSQSPGYQTPHFLHDIPHPRFREANYLIWEWRYLETLDNECLPSNVTPGLETKVLLIDSHTFAGIRKILYHYLQPTLSPAYTQIQCEYWYITRGSWLCHFRRRDAACKKKVTKTSSFADNFRDYLHHLIRTLIHCLVQTWQKRSSTYLSWYKYLYALFYKIADSKGLPHPSPQAYPDIHAAALLTPKLVASRRPLEPIGK